VLISEVNYPFTGHSSGGGLAALDALVIGLHAETFNSAALSDATMRDYGILGKSQANITANMITRDPLSRFQFASHYKYGTNTAQGVHVWFRSRFY
jgi:hypothetical protein